MGQHRRFPASFLLVIAVLAIPSVLYGFVSAAERADECAAGAIAKSNSPSQAKSSIKCE